MFGYRLESNGFTRGKCIRTLYILYAGARVQIKGPRSLFTIKGRNNTYDVTHFSYFDLTFLAGLLQIQIVATDIDINSHNYYKIDIRNLRLGLVHSWHYMDGTLALVFVLGFGFIF